MAPDRRSAVAARLRRAQARRQGFIRGQGRPLRLGPALWLPRSELRQQESIEDEKWPKKSFARSSLAKDGKQTRMESKDDTADAGSFINGVCPRFGGGANARDVREQGDRKKRPRARGSRANRFSCQMQARSVRTQGRRIEWQAAQRRREKQLHGEVRERTSLARQPLC